MMIKAVLLPLKKANIEFINETSIQYYENGTTYTLYLKPGWTVERK